MIRNNQNLPTVAGLGWPWQEPPVVSAGNKPELADDDTDAWPTITIVTPCLNGARHLEETLRSVLLQNYPKLEYIVMDGGSTDGTTAILERYAPWLSFWQSRRDSGQSDALTQGFRRANGDILAWINADDRLEPGALAAVARAFVARPDAAMVVGSCMVGDPVTGWRCGPTRLATYADFLRLKTGWFAGNPIIQPECFFRRRNFVAVGGLALDLHLAMDFDLWLRIVRDGGMIARLDRHLATLRRHPAQKTYDYRGALVETGRVAWKFLEQDWSRFGAEAPAIAAEIFGGVVDVATSFAAELAARTSLPEILTAAAARFSVVIPARNAEALVLHCVESIRGEAPAIDGSAIEIVVVDNGSTDGTNDQARLSAAKPKLVQVNGAADAAAFNAGAAACSREYVFFLDCRDALRPGAMSALARAVAGPSAPAVIVGTADARNFADSPPLLDVPATPYNERRFANLSEGLAASPPLPRSGLAIRRDIFQAIGGFDATARGAEGLDLLLRLGGQYSCVIIDAPPLVWQRISRPPSFDEFDGAVVGLSRVVANERRGRYPGGLAALPARRRAILPALILLAAAAHAREDRRGALWLGFWCLAFSLWSPRSTMRRCRFLIRVWFFRHWKGLRDARHRRHLHP